MTLLTIVFAVAWIVVAIYIAWWGAHLFGEHLNGKKPKCARCENSKRPLKWYGLFNNWYCSPCLNIVVNEQLIQLDVEIRHDR